jgi:putative spermidine/putrescine transport system substrate-binding protein
MHLTRRSLLFAAGSLTLAACASSTASAPATAPAVTTVVPATMATTVVSAVAAPVNGGRVDAKNWDGVVAAAKGQTVRWYLWGGSDSINRFVDTTYGPALKALGIKLERVPVADTVDAVNTVLAEQKAGAKEGSVDLIWINGENFSTLKKANLLTDGWARSIPNAKLVNWDNPAINLDFGNQVGDAESPWSSAQFQFVYDTTRTQAADLPRSYAALKTWACANPGRFTYIAPGPGAFQGTRFVKGALYELAGGPTKFAAFDQATWDQASPQVWSYLKDLKPCLWHKGETYPKDENELHKLFANNEVDFTITQAAAGPGALIADGLVPKTAKAFVFNANSIGDFNYVAIPSNASHPAAAMVLANLLLDPTMQAAQIVPANGFGLGYAIDVSKVSDATQRAALAKATTELGTPATDATELAKALVSDAAAPYQDLVEKGWRTAIVGGP